MQLGRLVRVSPREAWATEASEFTPWLAEPQNLSLLGEAIGLDLQFEAQEKSVGPFRADLLCKDTATDHWVLIENQLERTDHSHLGQLITYAAGLKVVTIVWIANPFTEEHRAALDWLNEITDSKINFFGLEVELWRIGDSAIAPKFNVVSKPNNWSKTVAEGAARVELTATKELQVEFWTAFREFVLSRSSVIRPTKALPQHWMNIAIGRSGFGLTAVASLWDSEAGTYERNEVRAEFAITADLAYRYFALLETAKDTIEQELGYKLVWHNPPGVRSARVFVRRPADLRDRITWPQLHEWLLDRLEEMYRVFQPRAKSMALAESVADNSAVETS